MTTNDQPTDALLSRGRAIWAMTGSTSEVEAALASERLDRFLAVNKLQLADLGPLPYPSARPLPPGARPSLPEHRFPAVPWETFVAQYKAEVTRKQDAWGEAIARADFRALNQMRAARGDFGEAPPPRAAEYGDFDAETAEKYGLGGYSGFKTVFNFGLNFGPPPTPSLVHSRFRDRVQEGVYVIQMLWDGIYACIGRRTLDEPVFVGLYGDKWEQALAASTTATMAERWFSDFQARLRESRSVYKLREGPPFGLTERSEEDATGWIDLDPDDVRLFANTEIPVLVATLFPKIIQAARQFETPLEQR